MNQNELRIGNWVNYGLHSRQITLTGNQKKVGIDLIITSYDAIEPVPLTAEVLIKCGFRQILDNYLFEKVINETLTLNVYKEGVSLHSKGCNFEITLPVFHLHRLQNLWFELTNTELEYK
jgi:hypothetical protein